MVHFLGHRAGGGGPARSNSTATFAKRGKVVGGLHQQRAPFSLQPVFVRRFQNRRNWARRDPPFAALQRTTSLRQIQRSAGLLPIAAVTPGYVRAGSRFADSDQFLLDRGDRFLGRVRVLIHGGTSPSIAGGVTVGSTGLSDCHRSQKRASDIGLLQAVLFGGVPASGWTSTSFPQKG